MSITDGELTVRDGQIGRRLTERRSIERLETAEGEECVGDTGYRAQGIGRKA